MYYCEKQLYHVYDNYEFSTRCYMGDIHNFKYLYYQTLDKINKLFK